MFQRIRWRVAALVAIGLVSPLFYPIVRGHSTKLAAQEARPPQDAPAWEAPCKARGIAFTLQLRSASGEVVSDDMRGAVRWADGTSSPVPIQPGWYMPYGGWASDVNGLCTTIAGTELSDGRVLLWLALNDRPSPNQLVLVLIAPTTKRILAVRERAGTIPFDGLQIMKAGGGFDVLLLGKPFRDANTSGQGYVPNWHRVTVNGDTIAISSEHAG